MKRAVLIKPGGYVEPAIIGGDFRTIPELHQIQQLVGGYIEKVRHGLPNMTAFCDENGYMKNLPVNELATSFFNTRIVGNVLVMGPTSNDGETHGLTAKQVNIFLSPEGEDILNELTESGR